MTWTGSVTSEPIILNEERNYYRIRLGHNDWVGGYVLTDESGLETELVDSVGWPSWSDFYFSGLVVAGNESVTVDLGTLDAFHDTGFPDLGPSESSARIQVTGTGVPIPYVSTPGTYILENADGLELYFQDSRGGMGSFNFGPVAATVVVLPVPEPSSTLLVLGGAVLLSAGRRRGRQSSNCLKPEDRSPNAP